MKEATRWKNQLVESQKDSSQKMQEHVDLIVRLSNELNEIGKELLKFIPNASIQEKAANSMLDKVKSKLIEGADKALQGAKKGASVVPVVGQALAAAQFIDELAKDYEKNQQIQAILKKMKNKLIDIDKVATGYSQWHEVQQAQVDALAYVAQVATEQACQSY